MNIVIAQVSAFILLMYTLRYLCIICWLTKIYSDQKMCRSTIRWQCQSLYCQRSTEMWCLLLRGSHRLSCYFSCRLKDDRPIERSSRVTWADDRFRHILTISKSTLGDAGRYSARITNAVGEMVTSANVSVLGKDVVRCDVVFIPSDVSTAHPQMSVRLHVNEMSILLCTECLSTFLLRLSNSSTLVLLNLGSTWIEHSDDMYWIGALRQNLLP